MVRYLIISVFVAAIVGIFFLLPVKIPYNVTVPGRALPYREWAVVRDRDGNIEAFLRDHAQGSVESYIAHRFERGDVVRLSIHPGLNPHNRVAAGDTVITIYSTQTQQELAQLTGQLAAAEASLVFYAAGEKEALILEAQTLVSQARDQAEQQQREVDRLRPLVEQSLVSQQEFEQAETTLQVLEADIAVAEARLDAVRTGAKPEQIQLTQAEADAVQREIDTLNDRLHLFTLTSPIDGITVRSSGSDTLLTIQDVSKLTIVMPVPWVDHQMLNIDQTIDVQLLGMESAGTARIVMLGDAVNLLNGVQVLLVTAIIDDVPQEFLAGAVTTCTLHHGDFSLPEYVRHFLKLPF